MKLRILKLKVTQRKTLLVGAGATLVVLTGLLLAYNFVFNPASSVHFTVYVPQQKQIYSNHLVISGYDDDSITIFGVQQAVYGYAIMREDIKVIQEKSTMEVNCDGIEKCITERTAKGQSYHYGHAYDGNNLEQVVVLKKGDTKITMKRAHKEDLSGEEWGRFIDTLEPASIGRPYVHGEHKWVLI